MFSEAFRILLRQPRFSTECSKYQDNKCDCQGEGNRGEGHIALCEYCQHAQQEEGGHCFSDEERGEKPCPFEWPGIFVFWEASFPTLVSGQGYFRITCLACQKRCFLLQVLVVQVFLSMIQCCLNACLYINLSGGGLLLKLI